MQFELLRNVRRQMSFRMSRGGVGGKVRFLDADGIE